MNNKVFVELDNVLSIVAQYCPDDDGSCSKAGVDLREMLDEIEGLPQVELDAASYILPSGHAGAEYQVCISWIPKAAELEAIEHNYKWSVIKVDNNTHSAELISSGRDRDYYEACNAACWAWAKYKVYTANHKICKG